MWAGSKDRDYKVIKSFIPPFDTYFEPFLGGGAVYFRLLADRGVFPAYCSDVNKDLIATYEVIRDDPEGLIALLPADKDKAVFKELLANTGFASKTEQGAAFLYLNRNRFFGMGGWMNADRYARTTVVERIRFFSPLMQRSVFSAEGCWSLPVFDNGAFVFCDPPYPEANNASCYKIDDDVEKLNRDYFSFVSDSVADFFWVTKHSDQFEEFVRSFKGVKVQKRRWDYRKPGQGVQTAYEIYASRDQSSLIVFPLPVAAE